MPRPFAERTGQRATVSPIAMRTVGRGARAGSVTAWRPRTTSSGWSRSCADDPTGRMPGPSSPCSKPSTTPQVGRPMPTTHPRRRPPQPPDCSATRCCLANCHLFATTTGQRDSSSPRKRSPSLRRSGCASAASTRWSSTARTRRPTSGRSSRWVSARQPAIRQSAASDIGRVPRAHCPGRGILQNSRLVWGGRAMWVRTLTTVPSNADALVETLLRVTPQALDDLARVAARDGNRVHAHLAPPIRRGPITTLHLRWWTEHDRSLTPSLDGELELRPVGAQSTELAITAQYRCREPLRELADSVFLRRVAESVVRSFIDSLVQSLEPAISAPALTR